MIIRLPLLLGRFCSCVECGIGRAGIATDMASLAYAADPTHGEPGVEAIVWQAATCRVGAALLRLGPGSCAFGQQSLANVDPVQYAEREGESRRGVCLRSSIARHF